MLADATEHVRTRIMEGTDIATPLKQTGAFPAVVGYMVAVGEQSGELEQMLDRIAHRLRRGDRHRDRAPDLGARADPDHLLAVVVGYIVISIVLPILKVGQIQ